MKKILIGALAIIVSFGAMAQSQDSTAEFNKTKRLPNFEIMLTDSTWFKNEGLPKKKPIVIVYFSPECGHCQLAAQNIAAHMNELKDAFFVWVSYYSVPEIKTFTENYKLAQYNNFRFGRDPKYAIPTFYKVRYTPFMAVYGKDGKLVQAFDQGAEPEILAKAIELGMHKSAAPQKKRSK